MYEKTVDCGIVGSAIKSIPLNIDFNEIMITDALVKRDRANSFFTLPCLGSDGSGLIRAIIDEGNVKISLFIESWNVYVYITLRYTKTTD